MSKAMEGYYELLELVEKKCPGKIFIRPREAAELAGCDIKTIMAAIKRKYNPLPARNVSKGIKNASYIIPITEFVRWSLRKL